MKTPRYPWDRLPVSGCFFVPTLRAKEVAEEGLRQAVKYRYRRVKATPGVHRGLYGVMFQRLA